MIQILNFALAHPESIISLICVVVLGLMAKHYWLLIEEKFGLIKTFASDLYQMAKRLDKNETKMEHFEATFLKENEKFMVYTSTIERSLRSMESNVTIKNEIVESRLKELTSIKEEFSDLHGKITKIQGDNYDLRLGVKTNKDQLVALKNVLQSHNESIKELKKK